MSQESNASFMEIRAIKKTAPTFLAMACLALVGLGTTAPAVGASGGLPAPPNPEPIPPLAEPKRTDVLKRARLEVNRGVRERKGDNVPRYRFGKGRIAPYSIRGNFWCAAFATWIWGEVGFDAFRYATRLRNGKVVNLLERSGTLWRAQDRQMVAVQVRALRDWAKKTGRLTYQATPGDLVAYGDNHIGIVTKVNQNKRAIRSIEGNYKNGVFARTIPMSSVIDYFTPVRVPLKKRVLSPRSASADVEFEKHSPDRPVIPAVVE